MKIDELKNEEMYALFAPDGSWQAMTLAPDFAHCVAIIKLLHSKGLGESFHELCKLNGFKILPVKVSITQNGDENKPFEKVCKAKRFELPTDEEIINAAILFNDGKIEKEKLADMVALCEFVINRLYETGNISNPSSKELYYSANNSDGFSFEQWLDLVKSYSIDHLGYDEKIATEYRNCGGWEGFYELDYTPADAVIEDQKTE